MKQHVLVLALLTATVAAAQQPNGGFSQKAKTSSASKGLAARLNAVVVPLPKNRTALQSLRATSGSQLRIQPIRLHVVHDDKTGLPVFIERKPTKAATLATTSSKTSGARLSAAAATSATYQFLSQVKGLLKVNNPEATFAVYRTETDDLGHMHVRMSQTYAGVRVLGSELVAHLTDGEVTLLNGRYQPIPDGLSTTPTLALTEASERALKDVRSKVNVRTFGDNILNMKPTEGDLCIFTSTDGAKLAYQLTVRPNMLERWEYVIDAQTGAVLEKYNTTCTFLGPIRTSGRDLNGQTRTVQTYQDASGYYMIDASRPMFNASTSKMPSNPVGALWTIDARNTYGDNQKIYQITSGNNTDWSPTAISAHYNAGVAYDYYRNTFNRNALNGNGATMISLINVKDDDGTALDNAYWNGKVMAYGNGKLLKPLAGALDVAGHEMTHGVIENTANLQYKSQSGAINESMADVFGTMIDRDDWTMGEDIATPNVLPSGAVRNLSNPNQGGKAKDPNGYQPATMSQYENTTDDNGGVHTNSGIPNFAYYKFATAIGKDKAEKVYYRALTTYLVRTSQFLDLRLAVIKAAGDLYGASGAEVTAAKNAFDAVGIVENGQTSPNPGKQPDVPVASGQDLLLLSDVSDSKLYSTNTSVKPAQFDRKTSLGLVHRPSVTDDGKYAYYVSTDKRIRAVNLTGTPNETIISDETIWDNVAISKDGTKLAALTADKDGSVYVYSYTKKKWAEFKLYNPTYSQGVATGDVQYADSFEWDFTGENIVYDAYNELSNGSGEKINYWDVGFINVWNSQTSDFSDGTIQKLFSDLEDGESVGNPSYSKNSPDIIAFDYFNENDDSYYVLATDLSTGNLKNVYKNNTLGFPSYSRLDNLMVFSTETNGREDVAGINLASDKVTPSGNATVLYTSAKWPVWYTQGTRDLPTKTAQTITFDVIADRYLNQGDLALKATSSSNLAVSFSVRSGPATLSGSTLKFTGIGAVTVRAYQDGNSQYAAATPVDRTFSILAVTGTEPTWADALSVYPNPVSSTLTVELPVTETLDAVSLKAISGATVVQPGIKAHQKTLTLDVSQLPKGLYLLQVETASGTANRKIVKE